MKSLTVKLTDDVASDIALLVHAGYFRSEQDLLFAALQEFMRHHRPDLEERYQREDIAWALRVAEEPGRKPR